MTPTLIAIIAGILGIAAAASAAGAAVGAQRWQQRRLTDYHRHKGLPPPQPTLASRRRERAGLVRLAFWHVRAFAFDGMRRPAEVTGPPVLCIHGYSQNATNLWAIRRVLEDCGRPTVAVSLRHRLAPMPWYAKRLAARMDHLAEDLGDRYDIVAHSMGGVILRMVLQDRPDLAERIRAVVTLGSPHQGTAAVRGIAWLPELAAMHRRSDFMSALPSLSDLLPHARVVTVAAGDDTVVYPTSTCLDPGTTSIVLHGIGHAGLLSHPRALATVRRALAIPVDDPSIDPTIDPTTDGTTTAATP